jgi:moderate conductance mechanosensitive channel
MGFSSEEMAIVWFKTEIGIRLSRLFAILLIAQAWASWALAQTAPSPPSLPATAASSPSKEPAATKNADPVRVAWDKLRFWSFADLINWLREHAISVIVILLVSFSVLWLANRLHHRVVALLAGYGNRGRPAEQENRARTLVGVLHNALRSITIVVACITVLEEIGVPVGPLLGGVAVVGLAVAFGTQSLIKDYFTGFLVLLEQQYMIGDVVRISGITGQVEKITLRVTVLRDQEGSAHFIPHGQIVTVTNLTHGWSQAVFDLVVPYGETVERVREVFFQLAGELRNDANYGPMILNDPEMLGVDSLSDTTFTVRFALRTLPLKRWEVKRELLRRIAGQIHQQKFKVSVPA